MHGRSDAFEHYPPALIKPFQWAALWAPAMSLVLKTLSDVRFQFAPLPLGLVAKHRLEGDLVRAWAAPSQTDRAIRDDAVAFILQMNARDTLAAAEKLRSFPGAFMVMWSHEDHVFPRREDRKQTRARAVLAALSLQPTKHQRRCVAPLIALAADLREALPYYSQRRC
jgi:hypothetical protein